MIASRVAASPASVPVQIPWPSGPRLTISSAINSSSRESGAAPTEPAMPHMSRRIAAALGRLAARCRVPLAARLLLEMDIDGKTFLVTGGSGFIGSHVVDALVEAGAERIVVLDKVVREVNLRDALQSGRVEVVEGDVGDLDALRTHLDGVDGVFHMAVLPLGPCNEHPRLGLSG